MGWSEKRAALQERAVRTFSEPIRFWALGTSPTTLTPEGAELRGIFRAASEELELLTELEIVSEAAQLDVRLEHLTKAPTSEDYVELLGSGRVYRIREVLQDGEGMAKLLLTEGALPA